MSLRMEKINIELRKKIMEIIQREIDDPTVEFLSITKVKTTSDLQESKVYFSLLDDGRYERAQEMLGKMKGFIRARLGKSIRLKKLPELKFIPDESIKYSVDIYQKIEEVKQKGGSNARKTPEENNSQDK